MASRGIKDRVAIIGMGCTKFGEHWDKGPEDLLVELGASQPDDRDANWLVAGYEQIALQIDPSQLLPVLDEVEAQACEMAIRKRRTVRHNRGTDVIEAGNVRFGLEVRVAGQGDGGLAIHVLGDIAGQEVELLAFDCFRIYPHYHYGPRYKNERIYLDKTLVPDPFKWALDQFKAGKLPAMLTRAGYPTVAAALDEGLVAAKLLEVEARAQAMLTEAPGLRRGAS